MVGTSKCHEANAKQLRIILAKENTQIEENTTKRNYLTGAITEKLFTKYIIQVVFQITCKNLLHDTIGIKCKALQNSKIKCCSSGSYNRYYSVGMPTEYFYRN